MTTGSELREPGSTLGPGEIYESNGAMLVAQLAAAGAEVGMPRSVADDEEAHRDAIEQGLSLDVLVTSGGVSVGPHDLVRRVEQLGVEEVFWGVAVKPGKPVSFGVRGDTLVFGLPGNPVSSLVACALFVLPAVEALQGATDPGPRLEWGRLAGPVRRDPHRDVFLRALAKSSKTGVELAPVSGQDSHMIARAAGANALALARRGDGLCPRRLSRRVPAPMRALRRGRRRTRCRRAASRLPVVRRRCSAPWRRPRVTGLQGDLLASRRLEALDIAGGDDHVARHAVDERPVRDFEPDFVTLAEPIDPRERRAVRRPVASDVDQLALAGDV